MTGLVWLLNLCPPKHMAWVCLLQHHCTVTSWPEQELLDLGLSHSIMKRFFQDQQAPHTSRLVACRMAGIALLIQTHFIEQLTLTPSITLDIMRAHYEKLLSFQKIHSKSQTIILMGRFDAEKKTPHFLHCPSRFFMNSHASFIHSSTFFSYALTFFIYSHTIFEVSLAFISIRCESQDVICSHAILSFQHRSQGQSGTYTSP